MTFILKKIPTLFLGLFLLAFGISLTITAKLGLNPWGVFHFGLTKLFPITFGRADQLTGLVILVLTCFIKIVPGFASVCNMFFVGMFVDLIIGMNILKTPSSFLLKLIMLLAGMFIISLGSYFYLKVELGAGPRDGLMEGLVKLLKRPVQQIRTSIDVLVLAIGYLLGGPVGIGTIILSLCTGTIIQWIFKIGKYNPKDANHLDFAKLYYLLKSKNTNQTNIAD
ncbi:membrane protein [Clostridium sp. 'deep sea']|uniref:YczE/YyaS/YitT family protein n=1 Tax=Clostridium sp. 'deep sea' TaxID=2779445 RepID=UPI001896640D|nr:membrane protein [Clostridium sp. 'deep sea']QOR36473.1 membrane protein [Clostridium sp. 'deep sea']